MPPHEPRRQQNFSENVNAIGTNTKHSTCCTITLHSVSKIYLIYTIFVKKEDLCLPTLRQHLRTLIAYASEFQCVLCKEYWFVPGETNKSSVWNAKNIFQVGGHRRLITYLAVKKMQDKGKN